jgi:hypothetical protein
LGFIRPNHPPRWLAVARRALRHLCRFRQIRLDCLQATAHSAVFDRNLKFEISKLNIIARQQDLQLL